MPTPKNVSFNHLTKLMYRYILHPHLYTENVFFNTRVCQTTRLSVYPIKNTIEVGVQFLVHEKVLRSEMH